MSNRAMWILSAWISTRTSKLKFTRTSKFQQFARDQLEIHEVFQHEIHRGRPLSLPRPLRWFVAVRVGRQLWSVIMCAAATLVVLHRIRSSWAKAMTILEEPETKVGPKMHASNKGGGILGTSLETRLGRKEGDAGWGWTGMRWQLGRLGRSSLQHLNILFHMRTDELI